MCFVLQLLAATTMQTDSCKSPMLISSSISFLSFHLIRGEKTAKAKQHGQFRMEACLQRRVSFHVEEHGQRWSYYTPSWLLESLINRSTGWILGLNAGLLDHRQVPWPANG
jgi:hypothetical protein